MDFIVSISSWVMEGGIKPFSEVLYSRDLGQIGIWVGIGTLGGMIFFRWDLKIPYTYKKQ